MHDWFDGVEASFVAFGPSMESWVYSVSSRIRSRPYCFEAYEEVLLSRQISAE